MEGETVLIEIRIESQNLAGPSLNQAIGQIEALGAAASAAARNAQLIMGGMAMQQVGAQLKGIAEGIGSIAEAGAEFQSMTQDIQNNTTMTTAQLEVMRAGILQLSQDSGIALDTLGQGFMKVMNLSGNAAASMAILAVANESAVSTGGNAASTANVLANALHEYGLDVVTAADGTLNLAAVQENAAHVMGVMHLAAAEGNMTLEQFSDSSGKAIGIAANLGVSLEDVSAAFSALTKHGFDAAQAGTQVTDLMTHMINPSKAAAAEIARVSKLTGVDLVGDFSAAGLSGKGLTGVLADLKTAYTAMGLTEAEAEQESMKLISAQRGGLGLASLLGTGYADYRSILGDLNNQQLTNTITEEAYNRTHDTAINTWNRLKQTLTATKIIIGEEIVPALTAAMNAVTPLIRGVAEWAQAHANLIGPILAVVAGLTGLLGVALTFGGALALAIPALSMFGTAIGAIGSFLAPLVPVLLLVGAAIGVFALAWRTNFLGIADAVRGVASVVGATIPALLNAFRTGDFNQAFGPIITAIDKAFGAGAAGTLTRFVSDALRGAQLLRDAFITVQQALRGDWFGAQTTSINGFVREIGHFTQLGRDAVLTFAAALRGEWQGSANQSINAVVRAFGDFGMTLQRLGPLAQQWLRVVVDAFKLLTGGDVAGGLQRLVGDLGRLGSQVLAFVGTLVSQVVGAWLRVATAFLSWLAPLIPQMLTDISQLFVELINAITGIHGPALGQSMAKAGSDAFTKWIQPFIAPFLTAVGGIFNALGTWIADNGPKIKDQLAAWGHAFADWVDGTAWPWLQPKLEALASAIGDWITGTALPWIREKALALGEALGTWVQDTAIPYVQANLPVWLDTVGGWISGTALPWIKDKALDLGHALADWVTDTAIPYVQTNLPLWLDALGSWITGTALPAIKTKAGELASALGDWVKDKAVGLLQAGLSLLTTTVSGAMAGLQAAISIGINAAVSFFQALPGRILGALGNLAGLLVQAGADLIQGLINGMKSLAGAVADEAAALAKAAADAVKGALGIHSPSAVMHEAGQNVGEGFVQGIRSQYAVASDTGAGLGVAVLGGLTTAIDAGNADVQKKIADTVSSVAKAIQDALAATKALGQFDPSTAPTGDQLGGFTSAVSGIIASIVDAAAAFSEKALAAASAFSDAAGKVFGLFTNALSAMKGLSGDFAAPTFASVHAFALAVGMIVQEMTWVASFFKAGALTSAADFADSASKVLGIISSGVAAIKALSEGPVRAVPFEAVHQFALNVGLIVQELQWVATFFKEQGEAQASAFAESAGKVLGIVVAGIAAMLALPTVVDPGFAAIHTFAIVAAAIVQEIQNTATFFKAEGLAQATLFSDAAGKILALIGPAIDGFAKFKDLVVPSQTAIDDLVYGIFEMVRKITEMASQLADEGVKQAGAFGDAAGSVFSAAKTAIDVFKGFKDLVIPSAQALDNLAIGMQYVVVKLGAIADQIGKDGLKKAQDFGTTVQGLFGALKSAMDILTGLTKFPDLARKALDAFLKGVQDSAARMAESASAAGDFLTQARAYHDLIEMGVSLIKQAQQALNTVSLGGGPDLHKVGQGMGNALADGARDALDSHSPSQVAVAISKDFVAGLTQGMTADQQAAAKAAADLASAIAKAVQDTLSAMTSLASFDVARNTPSAGQVGGVLGFIRQAIDGVRGLAGDLANLTTDAGAKLNDAAGKWLDSASKSVALFSSGVDALTKLAGYVQVGQGAIDNFGADLRVALNDLIFLSNEIAVDLATQAAAWSEQVAKAVAVYGTGADAFARLRGYTQIGTTAIYAFGKDLLAAVGDLAAMADLVGQELATRAGAFGEQVGKATGGLAAAVAGMVALRGYARVGTDAIYAFDKDLLALLGDFAAVADLFGAAALAKAGQLADTAGKIVAVIANGVAGFKALAGFVAPAGAAVAAFVAATYDLTKRIVALATGYAPELLVAAGQWADTAGKAVALLSNGTKGFADLAAFIPPAAATVVAFVNAVYDLTKLVVGLGAGYAADLLAAAGQWADVAAKAVGLLSNGAKGFADLATFVAVPVATVAAFVAAVADLVARIVGFAAAYSADLLTAAGQWADAAAKAVGFLSGGAKGFADLATFVAVPSAVIAAFVAAVADLVARVAALATGYAPDLLTLAGQFADLAGKAVGILSNGVKGLLDLATFQTPPAATIGAFVDTVVVLVQVLAAAGPRIAAAAQSAATALADTAGKALANLSQEVAGLTSVAGFVPPGQADIDAFVDAAARLLDRLAGLAARYPDAAITRLGAFGTALSSVFGALKQASDTLTQVMTNFLPSTSEIDAFLGRMAYLLDGFAALAARFTGQQLAGIQTFAATVQAAMAALKAGSDTLTGQVPTLPMVSPAIAFAEGGMITEPIAGVGLSTGRRYTFGEREAERVTPASKEGKDSKPAASKTYNVNVYPQQVSLTEPGLIRALQRLELHYGGGW